MGETKDGVMLAGLIVLTAVATMGFLLGWVSHSIIF